MGEISVILNVVNEEVEVLPQALDSVKKLAGEIVLVDMTSGNAVKKIAKKFEAKVFKHKFIPYVEPARNFGTSKASSGWILILDPDEEVPSSLRKKLKQIVKQPDADYYRLPRKNIIFGKWVKHSRWWPDHNIRFFKKGAVNWSEIIHAVPETYGKGLDLEALEKYAIIHHHYSSLAQYVERMNRYTTQHAKLKIEGGYEFVWPDLIKKPVSEFLSRYFQGEGYKDSIHGLALASLQAFSELVLHLKIWEIEKFKKKEIDLTELTELIKAEQKELDYWTADALIKEQGGLINRIKRKLGLR